MLLKTWIIAVIQQIDVTLGSLEKESIPSTPGRFYVPIPNGLDNIDTRYHAYISYSHVDVRFAAWLHRALETWRIPAQLSHDLGFSHMRPIFRDRSDLRAASDLGASLDIALDNSNALIVVCSCAAARSRWVGEEIKRFRQLHSDSRIFAILVADEPPDCFHPELLRDKDGNVLEPIAADARRGFDGRRDALLKTIAGLLNVEFDDLKHRDLRRQYQRMTLAAVVASTFAAVTIALAAVAYDARNEANLRREQAEDLISFMLGDLRLRLEPIGRLDVLDAVSDKTLDYFASLEDEDLTPDALLGRARALRQIGEVRIAQGKPDQALEAFRLSNDQSRRLLDETQNLEAEFEVGQSHFWIGFVHYERGEARQARAQWENYLEISHSLLDQDPENSTYRTEVAYAYSNLGSLELKENQLVAAQDYFHKTATINQAMVADSPDQVTFKQDLAETLSWLGEIASLSGDTTLAVSWFRQEHELRTAIVGSTDDMGQVHRLANTAMLLAHHELLAGNTKQATLHAEQAYRLARQLRQHDPDNVWWHRILAFASLELSIIAAVEGKLPEASAHVESAIKELENLGDVSRFQTMSLDMVQALAQQARVHRQLGNHRKALQITIQALTHVPDTNISNEAAGPVAALHLLNGDLLAASGNSSAAEVAWSKGLQSLDALPATIREPVAMLTRAALLDRTNKLTQAFELRSDIARLGLQDGPGRPLTRALIDGIP